VTKPYSGSILGLDNGIGGATNAHPFTPPQQARGADIWKPDNRYFARIVISSVANNPNISMTSTQNATFSNRGSVIVPSCGESASQRQILT
jgi:hypothetical protein